MSAEKWPQIKEILDAAVRRKPEERAAFLDEACGGDDSVRGEVESLLSSYGRADGFMESPALGNMGEVTEELKPVTRGGAVGRYEIVRELGVGGMGIVYLAKDRSLDRLVAIKLLNKKYERNEENVRRFVQEAKAASALNHPNILTIHEIGEFEGLQFIVSEYVDGVTLRDLLNEGRLEPPKVIDLAIQMAGALAAAHAAKIIHRDIKPENIVVRKDGYVKILDFGLAKLLPSQFSTIGLDYDTRKRNETAQGVILGTVSYMSPEQAKGEPVDARTDIFSLGVVIYEMISGRTPFAGTSTPETFANLIHNDAESLDNLNSNLPEGMGTLVSSMLEKDRGDRCSTMSEVVAALKELKEGRVSGSELARISSPNEETVKGQSSGPTGETVHVSNENSRIGRSAGRGFWYLSLIPVVLFTAGIAGWFLYPKNSQLEIRSLAVLPLKSLEPEDNYLGFGIADAVIRRISQTGALTVRPTSAVRRYVTEEADALSTAKDLSVDAVLEGTVQRIGEKVRITVNLLRTGDGASLWTEKYDAQLTDIFAVQDKVAHQVAARLQLQLDPVQQSRLAKRTTSDPIAYENYVKGVYSFNQRHFDDTAREQIDATIGFLKRAVDLDPKYALAHAKLAQAYAWKGLFIAREDQTRLLKLAQEEIDVADALDPQLAETHLARYRILFSGAGGWLIEDAVRECLTAQQIDPSTGHEEASDIYLHLGLEDLMDREIRKALEIDPTSEWVKLQMLTYYQILNRYDDYLRVRNEYFPERPISPAYYLVKGDLAKTREMLDQEEKKDPRGADPVLKSMLLALEGNSRGSLAMMPTILKEVDAQRMKPSYHHSTYDVACLYAVNNNAPEAVKWLRVTAEKGNPSFTLFMRDPFLDKIRQSSEFIQFMDGLRPQYERFRSQFK